MRKWFFFLFTISTICLANEAISAARKHDDSVLLISYPRSGRNWLLYSLYHLAPSYNVCHQPQLKKRFGYEPRKDAEKTIRPAHLFHKKHQLKSKKIPRSSKIILLLRNYRESFTRDANGNSIGALKNLKFSNCYFKQLDFFDSFPEENKLLVYYERLITEPESVFEEILVFLGEDQSNLNEFLDNFEDHKKRSIGAYQKVHYSASKGEDLLYHTRRLPQGIIDQMDQYVKETYQYFWEKYLWQYAFSEYIEEMSIQ